MTATPAVRRPTAVKNMADFLHALGDVPPERVRMFPAPGTATLADVIEENENGDGPVCEWVDGTLVEKAVGAYESWLGMIIGGQFDRFVEASDLGMLLGEAGVLRILPNIGRAGDVAFLAWASLPGGRPPAREDSVPEVVPDLVVEVLSESNRPGEMARKRREYFTAGVKHVWEIDPETQTARAYTTPDAFTDVPAGGALAADDVLPGFTLSLAYVFARAARMRAGE